jgi:hypothetical protein
MAKSRFPAPQIRLKIRDAILPVEPNPRPEGASHGTASQNAGQEEASFTTCEAEEASGREGIGQAEEVSRAKHRTDQVMVTFSIVVRI